MRKPFIFIAIAVIAALTVMSCVSADRKMITREVNKRFESIANCYTMQLVKNPKLKGEVEVTMTVSGKGDVIKTELTKNTFPDDIIGKCVAEIIKAVKFPENNQNKTITVPFPIEFAVEEEQKANK